MPADYIWEAEARAGWWSADWWSSELPEPEDWPFVPPDRLDLPACAVCGVTVMAARNSTLYHLYDDSVPSRGERSLLTIWRRKPRRHAATLRKDLT